MDILATKITFPAALPGSESRNSDPVLQRALGCVCASGAKKELLCSLITCILWMLCALLVLQGLFLQTTYPPPTTTTTTPSFCLCSSQQMY